MKLRMRKKEERKGIRKQKKKKNEKEKSVRITKEDLWAL